MPPSDNAITIADVTLILEGTYPYVAGGVSSWVHQILNSYPDRRFALRKLFPARALFQFQQFGARGLQLCRC